MSEPDDKDDAPKGGVSEGWTSFQAAVLSKISKARQFAYVLWRRFRSSSKFVPVIIASSVVVVLGLGGITWGIVDAQKVEVPQLTGTSLAEASSITRETDLVFKPTADLPPKNLQAFTLITSQSPVAGERVFPGRTIEFSYELVDVKVPNLNRLTLNEARSRLGAVALNVGPSRAQLSVLDDDATGIGVHSNVDQVILEKSLESLGPIGNVDVTGGIFDLKSEAAADSWLVIGVDPPSRSSLVAGSMVNLTLSLPLTEVPNVAQMKYSEAIGALTTAGIKTKLAAKPSFQGILPEEFSLNLAELRSTYWSAGESDLLSTKLGTVDDWTVVKQSVPPRQLATVGDNVELFVDWPSTKVPNLSHKSIEEVEKALHDAGLSTHDVSGNDTGVVYKQTPAPGTIFPMGASVSVDIRDTVTFSVTSSSGHGSITWAKPDSFSIQQANDARLPWSKTWQFSSAPGPYERGNFNAQMNSWNGWIKCEILVNGKVVESNKSSGSFAIVSCS